MKRSQNNKEFLDNCLHENESVSLADGFEDALMGIDRQFDGKAIAIYDLVKCVEIIMQRDGLSFEEAEKYFHINIQDNNVKK